MKKDDEILEILDQLKEDGVKFSSDKKYCWKCKTFKSIVDYYSNSAKKDGLDELCKDCSSSYRKQYNKRPHMMEYKRKYSLNRLYNTYGMSLEKVESAKKKVNYSCQICGKKGKELVVSDHDHFTNKFRGILCKRCNSSLGWYEKNISEIYKYLPYNPFTVVKHFEWRLSKYTNAPYVVTVTSCTDALGLCMEWHKYKNPNLNFVDMPKHTYISVPIQAIRVGIKPTFRDEKWKGMYVIDPINVYDSARRFTSNMYIPGSMMCVSFHYSKILRTNQGGAILHDNKEFDEWARKMRFDGRTEGIPPKEDDIYLRGRHCYMGPEVAAKGLIMLHFLPKVNEDLPNDDYPDLSQLRAFK